MREPLPNERYQDRRGNIVTVRSVVFQRVTFVREGYAHPCLALLNRFHAEFKLVGVGEKPHA